MSTQFHAQHLGNRIHPAWREYKLKLMTFDGYSEGWIETSEGVHTGTYWRGEEEREAWESYIKQHNK